MFAKINCSFSMEFFNCSMIFYGIIANEFCSRSTHFSAKIGRVSSMATEGTTSVWDGLIGETGVDRLLPSNALRERVRHAKAAQVEGK